MGIRQLQGKTCGPGSGAARAVFAAGMVWAVATAALAAPAPANEPPPASPARTPAAALRAPPESASLLDATPEMASPYRFVVKARSEPAGWQLLLGGLLAAIFIIRNRFRQR